MSGSPANHARNYYRITEGVKEVFPRDDDTINQITMAQARYLYAENLNKNIAMLISTPSDIVILARMDQTRGP